MVTSLWLGTLLSNLSSASELWSFGALELGRGVESKQAGSMDHESQELHCVR